jgi:hypothetical protein
MEMPVAVFSSDYKKAQEVVGFVGPNIVDVVAKAIAAERERCARISETCSVTVTDAVFDYGSAQINQAREDIAAAIRASD